MRWAKEKAHKVSIENDLGKIEWLDEHFGSVHDINTITRERVDGIMQLRGVSVQASSANSTANRFVALISGILNAAEREWEWGTKAPVLKRYHEPPSNGRALTLEEWRKLEKELPRHLKLAAAFSISTGLREAKVFGLKWKMLTDGSLTFTGTTNKLGNSIPLNASALAVLSECRLTQIVSPEYVFLYNGKPMQEHGQRSFAKAVERAQIGHVMWKDFRTTFNSWLAQAGVPEEIRKRLMGHKTNSVHDRYTRLYVEHLRPFSEIIDSVLAQSAGQNEVKTAVSR